MDALAPPSYVRPSEDAPAMPRSLAPHDALASIRWIVEDMKPHPWYVAFSFILGSITESFRVHYEAYVKRTGLLVTASKVSSAAGRSFSMVHGSLGVDGAAGDGLRAVRGGSVRGRRAGCYLRWAPPTLLSRSTTTHVLATPLHIFSVCDTQLAFSQSTCHLGNALAAKESPADPGRCLHHGQSAAQSAHEMPASCKGLAPRT